jgi:hypothetical protein
VARELEAIGVLERLEIGPPQPGIGAQDERRFAAARPERVAGRRHRDGASGVIAQLQVLGGHLRERRARVDPASQRRLGVVRLASKAISRRERPEGRDARRADLRPQVEQPRRPQRLARGPVEQEWQAHLESRIGIIRRHGGHGDRLRHEDRERGPTAAGEAVDAGPRSGGRLHGVVADGRAQAEAGQDDRGRRAHAKELIVS